MINNPYEQNEAWYDVTLSTGRTHRGFFSTTETVAEAGLWTLCLDEDEETWIDLSPAHIVSVQVVRD